MAQPYYARKTVIRFNDRNGDIVYGAQPYYNGTITTKQVAEQISQESALSPADVIGVIERTAYFCRTHMALGYKVKLDGIGTFHNQLITTGTVSKAEDVNAKLIKSIRPAFSPEYTILNDTFRYALLPEKTELVKVDFNGTTTTTDGTESGDGSGSGSETGGNTESGGSGSGIGGESESGGVEGI